MARMKPRPKRQARPPNHRAELVKYWSNTGQILVKYRSNTGQMLVKYWSNTGPIGRCASPNHRAELALMTVKYWSKRPV